MESTTSRAPPMAVVTTGRPAPRASTKAIPKGSGPTFGWQWMSEAARIRGTSDLWPRNFTRPAMPADRARVVRSAR